MAVRIEEINVQNLGPLSKFSIKTGQVNVIYGQNERGKTHLVEFLIRSMFRNLSHWQLRESAGSGKITVSGLESKKLIFSPKSSQKLEDFWDHQESGLPTDISRLLIVKGAEVELAKSDMSVDKVILSKYLSGQNLLDQIDNSISKTIQKAEIVNHRVVGNRQGELKEKERLETDLQHVQQLFQQIDKGYSGGRRKLLYEKEAELKSKIDVQERSKRHLAYTLHQKMSVLESHLSKISREKLQEIREQLRLHVQKIEDHKAKVKEKETAEQKSQHFEWLVSATDIYQNALHEEGQGAKNGFLILTVLAILGAAACVYFDQVLGAYASLFGVILFGLLYINSIQSAASQNLERHELKKIREEFEQRFGKPFTDLAMMRTHLQEMEEDYSNFKLLRDQLYGDVKQIEMQKLQIEEQFRSLTSEEIPYKKWMDAIRKLEDKRDALEKEYREVRDRFHQLNVDESDFCEEAQETAYSEQTYHSLLREAEDIQSNLFDENTKLERLRDMVRQQTGDDVAVSWEALIENLRLKREGLLQEYKQKSAEIVGKLMVHHVLQDLQKDEDVKIREALTSEHLLKPLQQITQRYTQLELVDDQLVVDDMYNRFFFRDLSTGAQEQILMALRIGFSAKLLNQDGLFFILDDAFQYSDWQRRDSLIQTIMQIAQSGWQIFYFTMDDHIRDLFVQRCESLKDNFVLKELGS